MRSRLLRHARLGLWASLLGAAALAAAATPAAAHNAYVANSGNGTVSVFDAASGAAVGAIAVGGKPVDVAISPDGRHAYVVDEQRDAVIAVDTATNGVVAAIPVGAKPRGIAIAPDGNHAYVTDFGDGSLSVVDLVANTALKAAIPVGAEPEGIALSRDGLYAYVPRRSGGIAIVDLGAARVVGAMPDDLGPSRIALGPNGGRALVTNADASSVSVFNPANGAAVGAPIAVAAAPAGIAVAPSGRYAYAASPKASSVTVIDTSAAAPVGAIGGLPGANGVAIGPSGARGIATTAGGSTASLFDTASGSGVGLLATGPEPEGVAVAPNQGPTASFWVSPQERLAKRKLTFHAGASSDPDGQIVSYAWTWGDGHHVKSKTGVKGHRYAKPGVYQATLVVTDNEGCSTEFVFTGQTASCNGSARAAVTVPIEVLDRRAPGLRLAGGHRQRVRGSIIVFAKCPLADCSLRARGTITANFERRGSKRPYTLHVGPTIASATVGSWQRLRVELPQHQRRAVLRALRNGGWAHTRLTVVAHDVHGLSQVRQRGVKLVIGRHGVRDGR